MNAWKWILPLSIIIGVVTVLLAIVIPQEERSIRQKEVEHHKTLAYYNKRLLEVNEILDDHIYLLENHSDSLRTLIVNQQKKIKELKTKIKYGSRLSK